MRPTRELIREVLKECGSEVITSRSAAEALVALEEHKPDILISDLGMPDEDGYSLISKIRALPASAADKFRRRRLPPMRGPKIECACFVPDFISPSKTSTH